MDLQDAGRGTMPQRRTYFIDQDVNERMRTHGYAVLDERLDRRQVEELHRLYRSAVDQVGRDRSGSFMPSMMLSRPDLRARLWDGVRQMLEPVIAPLLDANRTQVVGGSFVSKPSSEQSVRNPHQDPSVFDEERHVSISVWIPLSESHVDNGTLWMLPGSHRMGNHVRPPDVDSIDRDLHELAWSSSSPIELDAGRMLVIDGATVHHSPANTSGVERIAAIGALKPTGSGMWYARSDGGAPCGTAEVYEVGVEMYRSRSLVDPDLGGAELVRRAPYRQATLADLVASRPMT